MNEEISIREIKEMSDTSDAPFAMAILDDKCEVAMYGPYHADFAREMTHIPLYTKPQLKPLTEEEILEVWSDYKGNDRRPFVNFARAIEERHGIK